MRFVLVSLLFVLGGCATASEVCGETYIPGTGQFDRCVESHGSTAQRIARGAGMMLQGMGKGLQDASKSRNETYDCTPNYVGGYTCRGN